MGSHDYSFSPNDSPSPSPHTLRQVCSEVCDPWLGLEKEPQRQERGRPCQIGGIYLPKNSSFLTDNGSFFLEK